jgi:hypothetical protein
MAEMTDDEAMRAWEALGSDVATHYPGDQTKEGWQTTAQSKQWLAEYMEEGKKYEAGKRRKKTRKSKKNRKSKKKTRGSRKSTRK